MAVCELLIVAGSESKARALISQSGEAKMRVFSGSNRDQSVSGGFMRRQEVTLGA